MNSISPMGLLSRPTWRWVAAGVLLIAETEFLLDRHYEERTAVRALIGLPLYHILLATLAFAVLIRNLLGPSLPALPSYRISWFFLGVHVATAVSLNFLMTPLWKLTRQSPGWNFLWPLLIAVYMGSWLAALVPPEFWLREVRSHILWVIWAVIAGLVALGAAHAVEYLWEPLAWGTFNLSSYLLRFHFSEVIAQPADLRIGTPTFTVNVLAGCSGLEGIGLVASYTLAYLWMRRRELVFPQAFALVPAGVVAIWLANSVRVALLVVIGTYVSPAIALRGFHSQAGWLAFTIIGVSSILAVEKLGWFRKTRVHLVVSYPATSLVLPLTTLLFAWMLSQAFTHHFDLLYPVRMALVSLVLIACLPGYQPLLACQATWRGPVIGVLVYLLWIAMIQRADAPGPFDHLSDSWAAVWLAFRVLGAVIVIPLTEELAFRGFLLRRLQSRQWESVPIGRLTPVSLLSSSLAFGLLHQEWLAGSVAGLAYGFAIWKRPGLTDAIIAHGVTNLCIAVQALVLGDWWLW